MNPTVRPFDAARETEPAYRIYQATLGEAFPLTLASFTGFVSGAGAAHRVAEVAGEVRGVVIAYADGENGCVSLVAVAPTFQRQGVGGALLRAVREEFAERGVMEVSIGAGVGPYLWHGVPDDLPTAGAFFRKYGADLYEDSCDLAGDLSEYVTPPYVWERANVAGVTVRTPNTADIPNLLAFEEAHFPFWRPYFEETARTTLENIRIAERYGEILGSVLLSKWPDCSGSHWHTVFGEDMGSFGCVGVREEARGQGVGLALVAASCEELQRRGVCHCFVHWTWLPDWYGKLGFRLWKNYRMARFPTPP